MNTASLSFGRRLRSSREHLGISLEAIAAATKINRSLFADLERGDASKWPGGIYRRAFVREYAAAIGLPAEEVLAEFCELFPEEGAPADTRTLRAEPSSELRLTLVEDRKPALNGAGRRVLVATFEVCAIVAFGWLLDACHKVGVLDGLRRDRFDLLPDSRGMLDSGAGARVAGGHTAVHRVRAAVQHAVQP